MGDDKHLSAPYPLVHVLSKLFPTYPVKRLLPSISAHTRRLESTMEGYPGVHYTPITAITADGEHRTVRRSPSPRPRTSLSRSSRVLMALLLAFLVTMLAAAILIVLDRKEEGETFPPRRMSPRLDSAQCYRLADRNALIVGQSSVLFENDALFSSEPSPHSNTAWDSLLPSASFSRSPGV